MYPSWAMGGNLYQSCDPAGLIDSMAISKSRNKCKSVVPPNLVCISGMVPGCCNVVYNWAIHILYNDFNRKGFVLRQRILSDQFSSTTYSICPICISVWQRSPQLLKALWVGLSLTRSEYSFNGVHWQIMVSVLITHNVIYQFQVMLK